MSIMNHLFLIPTAGIVDDTSDLTGNAALQVSVVKGLLGSCTTKFQDVGKEDDTNVPHGAGDVAVATIDSFQVGECICDCH